MPLQGNPLATAFSTINKQTITGNGTVGPYTLDYAAGSDQDVEVFVNNVRQEPGVAYTVAGTSMTMTGVVQSSDDFYVVFQGKAQQSVTHPSNSALAATTGTFSGDLTVDTNTLYVDSTNNRVGIGTTSPASRLSVGDSTVNSGNVATFGRRVTSAQSNLPLIGHTSHDGSASDLGICATSTSGNIIFYTGNDAAGFGTGSNAERVRITNNGITFNGDTAAANALDDYEEGTWTAEIIGSTTNPSTSVTINSARYTKIGRQVFCQFQFNNVNTTGASGGVRISGLPFTAATSYATGNVMTYLGMTFPTTSSNISPYVSSTSISFYYSTNQGGWAEITHNARSGVYLAVTVTYEAV